MNRLEENAKEEGVEEKVKSAILSSIIVMPGTYHKLYSTSRRRMINRVFIQNYSTIRDGGAYCKL